LQQELVENVRVDAYMHTRPHTHVPHAQTRFFPFMLEHNYYAAHSYIEVMYHSYRIT